MFESRVRAFVPIDWRTLRDANVPYNHPIFDLINRVARGFLARLRARRLLKIRRSTDQVATTRKRLRDSMSRTASNRRIHPGSGIAYADPPFLGTHRPWFRGMDMYYTGFSRPGSTALARV